ncbi:MAG: Gfo/Idh/MocA family oxidoreductase [Phycisphaerae bacterium]|nr:Gfo/Idh/MocA family oxidoreductase [Phycisphaerae bacterium]
MAQNRVVVVGCGGISRAWFPPLIAENVEVCAAVDLNTEVAKTRLAAHPELANTEVSDNFKKMLKRHKPQFVLDLTVPEAHCEVTCTALRAGCHVIGEKPMAASMTQARKMVKTAEETGNMYMVSQSRRWDRFNDACRLTVNSGELGELNTINCDFYLAPRFGGFRDEMDSPLILDMSIHHFDLIRFMSGKDPVSVYAHEYNPKGSWYKGDVAASCIFEMSDGVMFNYRGSWCADGCWTSWHGDWRYIGDKGTMIYNVDKMPFGQVRSAPYGSETDKPHHQPLKDLPVTDSPMPFSGFHGGLREMLAFLNEGKRPQTECHDNIKSLAMVFAAIESSKKGRRVEVKI